MRRRHRFAFHAVTCAAAFWVASLVARAPAAEVALTRDTGMYRVPVTLNGRLVRSFIVDTGAGEVQVSSSLLRALIAEGSTPPVFLPAGTYRLADGHTVRERRFVIERLRIGDRELHQVTASIGGPDAALLLGQNVLERLGTWSIDTSRGVLVLSEPPMHKHPATARSQIADEVATPRRTLPSEARPSRGECANWRTAPDKCEVAAVRDFLREVRPPHYVTTLTLLRSDGQRASVLVGAMRSSPTRIARLCGPVDLRYAERGWRVVAAPGLREIGSDVWCVP